MRTRSMWTKQALEDACLKETDIELMIKKIDNKGIIDVWKFDTVEKMKGLYNELYGYLLEGFTFERLRTHNVNFRLERGGEVYSLQLRRFVTNMILWRPIVELGERVEYRHMLPADIITGKIINDYYNKFYIDDFINKVDFGELNKILSDTTFALSRISTDFNLIMGMVVNLESYQGTGKKFPRFEEIMRFQLDTNAQPHEIEQTVSELTKEQVSILKQDHENIISAMLISGAGVRESALQEFVVASSNKPDLAGNTMPVPIDRNFLMGGLSNIVNYYIDAVAGRKSIIMNKTEMGKSGYFAFLVTLLNAATVLDKRVEDCHSVRTLHLYVKSKKHLEMVVGRYYVPEKGKLAIISSKDTHLIGTTIKLRSPATCACKGNRVCKTCYGEMSEMIQTASVGGLSAIVVMLKVQQDILSAKHILTTLSTVIRFNQEFYKTFKLYANEIVLDNDADDIDDSLHIIIDGENLEFSSVFERDLSSTNIHEFSIGRIKKKRKKDGEDDIDVDIIATFKEENNSPMALANDIVESDKVKENKAKNIFYIPIKDIDEELAIFTIEIENNELTKPLYDIKHILDRDDHNGNSTIDEIANAFLDATISAKIPVKSVNIEILLHPMIRRVDNKFERPNFRKHVFDSDIRIMTVRGALKNNPSPTLKLSSEALEFQLRDVDTYSMNSASYLDELFKERLMPIMEEAVDNLAGEINE